MRIPSRSDVGRPLGPLAFALARAFQRTGLDRRTADLIAGVGMSGALGLVVLLAVTVVVLTNVTSNTATASVFTPIAIGVAGSAGAPPLTLMATVALAASFAFAFVLPVATAPNAIVFGSGYLTIPEMARVGLAVSVVGIAVIVVGVGWWLPFVWGDGEPAEPEPLGRVAATPRAWNSASSDSGEWGGSSSTGASRRATT